MLHTQTMNMISRTYRVGTLLAVLAFSGAAWAPRTAKVRALAARRRVNTAVMQSPVWMSNRAIVRDCGHKVKQCFGKLVWPMAEDDMMAGYLLGRIWI